MAWGARWSRNSPPWAGPSAVAAGTPKRSPRFRGAHGAPHYFQQANVTDEEEVASFCAEVLERHGAPDLLLNNAAIVNHNAPLWEVSAKEFSDVIDVNIKGDRCHDPATWPRRC